MGNKKVILAVDDMTENLTTIRVILGDHFDLRLAKSAKMALGLLKNLRVDLILLDLEMPDISGFEFLEILAKTLPERKDIPVIFVTAQEPQDFMDQAADLGVQDYVIKPITAESLRTKIQNLLNSG